MWLKRCSLKKDQIYQQERAAKNSSRRGQIEGHRPLLHFVRGWKVGHVNSRCKILLDELGATQEEGQEGHPRLNNTT